MTLVNFVFSFRFSFLLLALIPIVFFSMHTLPLWPQRAHWIESWVSSKIIFVFFVSSFICFWTFSSSSFWPNIFGCFLGCCSCIEYRIQRTNVVDNRNVQKTKWQRFYCCSAKPKLHQAKRSTKKTPAQSGEEGDVVKRKEMVKCTIKIKWIRTQHTDLR